jgi:hypothetical protein
VLAATTIANTLGVTNPEHKRKFSKVAKSVALGIDRLVPFVGPNTDGL